MGSSQPRFAILYDRTRHMISVRHMIDKCRTSSMNRYNCTAVRYHVDAQELRNSLLLGTISKTGFRCSSTQHYSFFQIAICCLWRQMMLIKDVFHPASYTVMTVDHSQSGVTAWKFVDKDCARKSRDLQIVHVCYAILRLAVQSWDWNAISGSENVQHLRLHEFSDCAEIHKLSAGGGRHCCLLTVDMRLISVGASPHMWC